MRDEDPTCVNMEAVMEHVHVVLYRQVVNHHHDIPVSQICNRTTVSVSVSITRLVIMLAPTVEVIWAGLKAPLQKRVTRDVLPTPWEPRTTILASREDDISSFVGLLFLFLVSVVARDG